MYVTPQGFVSPARRKATFKWTTPMGLGLTCLSVRVIHGTILFSPGSELGAADQPVRRSATCRSSVIARGGPIIVAPTVTLPARTAMVSTDAKVQRAA